MTTASTTSRGYLLGRSSTSVTSDFGTGSIYVSSNVSFYNGGFYTSSDENIKTIKGEVKVTLEELLELRKVFYTFTNDETNKVEIGTIAQDVQKICPEIVGLDEDGRLSVAYSKLSVLALKAIDDLNDRIKELEEILNED
jgi:hypothetical protein